MSRARTVEACRAAVARERKAGRRIGFVPTMGALHEGHLSLVDHARERSDWVILSVFVNPLQFGPREDFERYPRNPERDARLAVARGADLVFEPSLAEMLPRPLATRVTMEGLTDALEGEARPGHFDGVLTIVTKLFHVVQPDVAVFGQKDAQQAAAVKRLVLDLDFPVEIVVAPIVRDLDGVALSSRNAYLSEEERRSARSLSRSLDAARSLVEGGERDAERVERVMRDLMDGTAGVQVEYAAVVDPEEFTRVERIEGRSLAAVAARVGGTRLIDNAILTPE
ncbi:MAG TPA: pantoate--beta-alanine ligase [Gemmatimonadota bacterium]|nr:pantoate--beta-alanine ligase [Gemmatimonadota bacterium]